MFLGVDDSLETNLVFDDKTLNNTEQQKVLDVTLDDKLKFTADLLNITKNANKKFNALTRVQKYKTTEQKSLFFSPL